MLRKYEYRRRLPHYQSDYKALFVTFNTYCRWILPESARAIVFEACLYANQKRFILHGLVIMPDHVHLLIGMSPDIALSDLVKDVKVASSSLINDKRWVRGHFNWQRGFGAFSYSRSQVSTVAKYIENQERHHARRSFRDEYVALLKKFDVEYDPKYLFTFIDDVGLGG